MPQLQFFDDDAQTLIDSPFPCAYLAPGTWGWSVQNADELHHYFLNFNACHLPNPYNDTLLNTLSVSYARDPNNSQCFGGYRDPSKPKNKALEEEEEHCSGLVLPSSQAPNCIRELQQVLNSLLHKMAGYEKSQINYLSVMHYPDENAGITWHKHAEDNGCDTPVLLVSTGAVRDFYVGKINKTKPKAPDVWWKRPMEHGSLVVMPDAMNYTHWHAILKNTPENRRKYDVPNVSYGPRISINSKCLRKPTVFRIQEPHPRWAVYVGCKYGKYEGTPYGNGVNPIKGHYPAVADTEEGFRNYAEQKMLDPVFREQAIRDLRGKHLLCWKHPGWCHAQVWLEIVNRPE